MYKTPNVSASEMTCLYCVGWGVKLDSLITLENMAYLVANRSEGKLTFKKLQQSCITSLLTVLNVAQEFHVCVKIDRLQSLINCDLNVLRTNILNDFIKILNDFIKNRLTAKSKELTSDFGKKKHSRPYCEIGMHLHLTSSINTSSETNRPIFPKIAFVAL